MCTENNGIPPALAADHSVRLSKGFVRILLSIPLGLLLLTGVIQVRWLPLLYVPPYLLAVALLGWGCVSIWPVQLEGKRWRAARLRVAGCGILLLYFAPFFHWWVRAPTSTFLTINVMVAGLTGAILCYFINDLIAAVAASLGLRTMRIEARLSAMCVVVLMVLPLLSGYGYAAFHAWRYHWPLAYVLEGMRHLPMFRWFWTLPLAPVSLTIMMCWKVHRVAEQQLVGEAGGGEGF